MSLAEQQNQSQTNFNGLLYPFRLFQSEIKSQIWKICVQDYSARIVDLREDRWTVLISSLKILCTHNGGTSTRNREEESGTKDIAGFTSS
jgi:hypothetical protein